MSTRHRSEVAKPAPSERRLQHHRDRQAERHALAVDDPDDVLDPRTRHTLQVEHPGTAPVAAAPRRFRHWKEKFWKRSSALRRARKEVLARLEGEGDGEEPVTITARRMASRA